MKRVISEDDDPVHVPVRRSFLEAVVAAFDLSAGALYKPEKRAMRRRMDVDSIVI